MIVPRLYHLNMAFNLVKVGREGYLFVYKPIKKKKKRKK